MATSHTLTTMLHHTTEQPMSRPSLKREDYEKSIARSRVASHDPSKRCVDKPEDFWKCVTEGVTARERKILGECNF